MPVLPSTLLLAENDSMAAVQVCLCWTQALQTISKQTISLLPHLLCSGQVHLDVKALCPGRLALTSSYNTPWCKVSESSFQAGEAGSVPNEPHGAHFHSPEDLSGCGSVPPLTACIYCNDCIYWQGCTYYTYFPLHPTATLQRFYQQ